MSLCVRAQQALVLPAEDAGGVDLKQQLKQDTGRPGPRRVNRWIQLALLGARQCVQGLDLADDTAILLTTRNGAVGDTLSLLTGNAHDQPPAPFQFINVSGNMAAYYLAADLKLNGANQVIVSYQLPFFSLLEMAWLNPAPAVLLGAVEELVWPLEQHRQRLRLPVNAALGESSHWLLLQRDQATAGPRLQTLKRCCNDDEARAFVATLEPASVCIAEPAAAQRLQLAPGVLSHSSIDNRLDDAELILNWLAGLKRPAWLGLQADGQWAFIHAEPQ